MISIIMEKQQYMLHVTKDILKLSSSNSNEEGQRLTWMLSINMEEFYSTFRLKISIRFKSVVFSLRANFSPGLLIIWFA